MWRIFLSVVALASAASAVSPIGVLSQADQDRLQGLFSSGLGSPDVSSVHYSAAGLSLLESTISDSQAVCDRVKNSVNAGNAESLYHAASAAKYLKNCKLDVGDADSVLKFADGADSLPIFHVVAARKALGLPVDTSAAAAGLSSVISGSKVSIASQGYALLAASLLEKSSGLTAVIEAIEDVVNFADEYGGNTLQFLHYDQDGLPVTAAIVSGMFGLSGGAAPSGVKQDQVIMLANYFLRSRHTGSVADAFHVLLSLQTIAKSKVSPLTMSLTSSSTVPVSRPVVQVRATNLLDQDVKGVSVMLTTAGQEDEQELASDEKLKAGDNGVFVLDLASNKPSRGLYSFRFSTSSSGKQYVAIDDFSVDITFVGAAKLTAAEFVVLDAEQGVKAKSHSLSYPKALGEKVSADHHQKLVLTFTVQDGEGQALSLHQAFVQLTHVKTGQEIFFVAEADDDQYKFEVNLGTSAKESFNSVSGDYDMTLIAGDGLVTDSISWKFGTVSLSFPGTPSVGKSKLQYGPRPEIKHVFRQPEKRPAAILSNAFTLAVLSPLAFLLAAWLRVGANLSNFGRAGLNGILFLTGLSAIMLLYTYFWLDLNMFSTLKWLAVIGAPTFVFGNRLLANMAAAESS